MAFRGSAAEQNEEVRRNKGTIGHLVELRRATVMQVEGEKEADSIRRLRFSASLRRGGIISWEKQVVLAAHGRRRGTRFPRNVTPYANKQASLGGSAGIFRRATAAPSRGLRKISEGV